MDTNINLEELEETLSFCDLSFENQDLDDDDDDDDESLTCHHDHELFEFPLISNTHLKNNRKDIVFCGKLMNEEQGFVDGDQSRCLFPLSSTKQFKNNKSNLGSIYLVNSKSNSSLISTKSFGSQRCSSFRKHKVLIGLIKIPAKMELSDLKKRQSRRNQPSPVISTVVTNEVAVVNADGGCYASGKRWHLWSLLRYSRRKSSQF